VLANSLIKYYIAKRKYKKIPKHNTKTRAIICNARDWSNDCTNAYSVSRSAAHKYSDFLVISSSSLYFLRLRNRVIMNKKMIKTTRVSIMKNMIFPAPLNLISTTRLTINLKWCWRH
jgi:hypothetical protein